MHPDSAGPVAVWAPPGPDARPFHRMLAEAAQARSLRFEVEPRFRHLARLVWPDGAERLLLGNALGLNGDAPAAIAADKTYAAQVLRAAGLVPPEGCLVTAPRYRDALALKNTRAARHLPGTDAALQFAGTAGYPVFVKPNRGSEGADVSRAATQEQLRADLSALLDHETHVRVEAACPGRDLRVIVFQGRARLAALRRPACVTGDGETAVGALIDAFLDRLARTHRGPKLRADDPRILRTRAAAGLSERSVPAPGQIISLLPNANLSTGGTVVDVSDAVPGATARLAERAAGALGLTLAGVDLLVPDPALGPAGATVLEVNAAPGLDFYASAGPAPAARARALLADMVTALHP